MNKLLNKAGAFPFLIAVFLNSFVDLGHKIVIQNTVFKMHDGHEQMILTAIVNALILLPFILLFSPAGFTSDKYPKNRVMKLSAWAAVFLTTGITVCYALGWFWVAFGMTFLLAAQSAFYSPSKYGYIKGFFGKQHLAEANGLVQAISIIAILAGTIAYSILFEMWFPKDATSKSDVLTTLVPVGGILMICSILELLMMYRLPKVDEGTISSSQSEQRFELRRYLTGGLIKKDLHPVLSREAIFLSVIGLSMFWALGQIMLVAFPAFAKAQMGETNTVVIQAIVGASGVGIALGASLASRWSRNYIETGLIPLGAAGIAIFLGLLPHLNSLPLFALDFLIIGIMGGLFIVPLNSLVQFYAGRAELGKVLAGNNLIQNIAMLSVLLLSIVFSVLGIGAKQLLIFASILAVVGGIYTVYKLPQSLVRFILSGLMSQRYRINVMGMKNIPEEGGVLLLGNHISWIDWAIVQLACPRPVQFVMIRSIYELWYLKWFFKLFGCVPIEQGPSSKGALDTVTNLLDDGKVVCLFPEGGISRNGHLAEFKRGYEKAAQAACDEVVILPFYLRGLWGSQFSRSSEGLKNVRDGGWRRDVIVAFGEAIDKDAKAEVLKQKIFSLSVSAWNNYSQSLESIPEAWVDTAKRVGKGLCIADPLSGELSARRALTGSILFSRRIKRLSPEQNVGVLLPSSAGGILTNMAALLAGKTLVNLNYSASKAAFASSISQADIKTVYTSKRFLTKLEGRGIDFSKELEKVNVVYVEEIKEKISKFESLRTLVMVSVLPPFILKRLLCRPMRRRDDFTSSTACILFSSGSEGAPKGIELSHTNIMANLKQVADVLNTEERDVIMASLPLFHAFGLTVTQFMPLVEGMPIVCQPDPTDVLNISKAVAKYNATILFGTSTFFRLYVRNSKIHPLMLDSLRLVIAGAEKMNAEVAASFTAKFNKRILEGYGATETTPVASVNLEDYLDLNNWKVQKGGKPGTVGMPLPGTNFKIVDPDTYEELPYGEEGMILIGGAQVMKGYLKSEDKTNAVIRVIDGIRWYETGDKGRIDNDGFLTIVDRYSRFAKLGGEMISLSLVEREVSLAICQTSQVVNEDAEHDVVAVAIPDDKKGERIVILIENQADLDQVKQQMLANGCNPLMVPSSQILVDELPKLGSGKTDFSKAKQIAVAER